MARALIARLGLIVLFFMMPTSAWAQTGSGIIAGGVRDATGAVLPGVTVEASSPALIEKVRSVVTDGEGQYKIVELRPGTYTVTFTLTGFNTVRREGIEITTGFTASVNAELKVGEVSVTIDVSGQSPVVDVQNSRQQVIVSREVADTVPTGKQYQNMAALRACQRIRACTADPCVVRCGRGSGHAAGQAYGSLPGVDGAIAPTVGGDGSASDRLWRHCAGGACDGDRGVDDSAGPA